MARIKADEFQIGDCNFLVELDTGGMNEPYDFNV